MPSLTEVITPSLASTTGASKLAILFLRISPISSLRIAISCRSRPCGAGACAAACGGSGERGPQLLQPCAQAAVDDAVADTDDESPDDRGVLPDGGVDAAAEPLGEGVPDVLLQRLVERDRGGHLDPGEPGGGVGEGAIALQHRAEDAAASALDEQPHQVAGLLLEPVGEAQNQRD